MLLLIAARDFPVCLAIFLLKSLAVSRALIIVHSYSVKSDFEPSLLNEKMKGKGPCSVA